MAPPLNKMGKALKRYAPLGFRGRIVLPYHYYVHTYVANQVILT